MDNTKDYILSSIKEFIILALWIVFFVFLAIYIKYYKNIDDLATLIIKFIAPLAIFIFGAAKATSRGMRTTRRLREKGEGKGEFSVTLTYIDKWRHDLTAYVTALVILVIPYFFDTEYSWAYVLAACFSFLAIWWLRMFYFKD
ncbi:hypothetical protein KKA15_06015 [Patescibacteria group bacterium]|nr:hypothetical protein [Patescibacteria group bacterium]